MYVSQLPESLTEQQFVDMMQKCGLVLKDPETAEYKVKLYKDAHGKFKGDALCTYIKVSLFSSNYLGFKIKETVSLFALI